MDGMSREGEGELVGYRRKLTKGLGGVLRVCKGASRVELGNVVVFDWGDLKGLQGESRLSALGAAMRLWPAGLRQAQLTLLNLLLRT